MSDGRDARGVGGGGRDDRAPDAGGATGIQLRHLCRVTSGATPESGRPEYWDGQILWVTPEDLSGLASYILRETRRKITLPGFEACGVTLAKEGSIVLTKRAPIGQVAVLAHPACSNQGCFLLTPTGRADSRFIYYWLTSQGSRLQALGRGSTFMELSTDDLKALKTPVPPLEQQRAIADYLDRETARIDALIAAKERLLGLLAEKRRALITHAVTRGLDPTAPLRDSGIPWLGPIPSHWATPPVYACFEVQLGRMLDEKRAPGQHQAPYLRNVDVQWDSVNTADLPEMDFAETDRVKYALHPGDILVCEGGEVGRSAIWRGERPDCFYQKALHRLRALHSDLVLPEFFAFVMRACVGLGVFGAMSTGSTIEHLPAEKLRNLRFPLPPLMEQQAIVKRMTGFMEKLTVLNGKIEVTISLLRERRAGLIAAMIGNSPIHCEMDHATPSGATSKN